MDDIQNNVFDDNYNIDDNISDNNDSGVEEVRENESEEITDEGQDVTTTPDYSDILSDINSNLSDVYEYLIGIPEEEITLSDIHQDMRILTCVVLLFFGYLVMRSLVFKMRRF